MKTPTVPFSSTDLASLPDLIDRENIRLSPAEAKDLVELLGRDPTRVEAVLFDTLWSEHCSYKSSRSTLKEFLPTEAPHVVLGPGEDAGAVYLTTHNGERYLLVVGHESHNHPSQVVPFEGAATGIGGVVRDVYCMGADVVGVLDGLRFGSLQGPQAEQSREIARAVVDGIWHYANALGVPNLGGDTLFDAGYNDNCLVNVVAVGVVKEKELVRSRVPANAKREPYVLILLGKPTDASGFGGASFASAVLDESESTSNKGAVQVPDPFLKRVLSEANRAVLRMLHEEGCEIGFKDLGAGGIACATSEMADAGGFGADVELSAVALDGGPYPPEVIACSETQERYCLAVPQRLSQRVLQLYNVDFDLPGLYPGACAQVVGHVRTEDTRYRLMHEGDVVADTSVEAITQGIRYDRVAEAPTEVTEDPILPSFNFQDVLLEMMSGVMLASRAAVYRYYDTEVKGCAVFRPGEADAAVLVPVPGNSTGLAVSLDGIPFHGEVDPYWGGAGAVAEGMRNVAAVGATPWCLTDCLNYGNPEDPSVFYQFREGVRGVGDAAREIGLVGERDTPVPVVSGNVSFYNQSAMGKSVPPSPIIATFGVMSDYSHAVTARLKQAENNLVLLGRREGGFGGSALVRYLGIGGGPAPQVDFKAVRAEIETVLEGIAKGWVVSAHDISEGGLVTTLAEMCLGTSLGVSVSLESMPRPERFLFTEAGGFVLEVATGHTSDLLKEAQSRGAWCMRIGQVDPREQLVIHNGGTRLVDISTREMEASWSAGLREALA